MYNVNPPAMQYSLKYNLYLTEMKIMHTGRF